MGASTSVPVNDNNNQNNYATDPDVEHTVAPLSINELREKQAEIYGTKYTHSNTQISQYNSSATTTDHHAVTVIDDAKRIRLLSNPADDHVITHQPSIQSNNYNHSVPQAGQLSPSVTQYYNHLHQITSPHTNSNSNLSHHSNVNNHHHTNKASDLQVPLQPFVIPAHVKKLIQPDTVTHTPTHQHHTHSTQTSPLISTTHHSQSHHTNNVIPPTITASPDIVKNAVWGKLILYCHHIDTLPSTFNAQHIADTVLSIPVDNVFLSELTEIQRARHERKKLSALASKQTLTPDQESQLQHLTTTLQPQTIDINYDLTTELLQIDKQLSTIRRQYVPSRVSEDWFWCLYWKYVYARVSVV